MDAETLGFVAEWYDPQPQITRRFLIKVFTDAKCLEIVDLKSKKGFLKRTPLPQGVAVSEFVLGGKVLLYARLMHIVDYADSYTRRKLAPLANKAVVVVSPDGYGRVGQVLEDFIAQGLCVSKLQSVLLSETEALELVELVSVGPSQPAEQLTKLFTSGPSVAVELSGASAPDRLSDLLPDIRRKLHAQGVEAVVWNGQYLDDFFFGGSRHFQSTARLSNCTCAVIRPHAVKNGDFARILDEIQAAGFGITAMQMFELNPTAAKEFLEVYDGVLPNFSEIVQQFCTGPCVALEVVSRDASIDVVGSFREFLGPWDVEMAKELKPQTIRAKYGVSRALNAIHCTDLPEDGVTESAYFFDLLQNS